MKSQLDFLVNKFLLLPSKISDHERGSFCSNVKHHEGFKELQSGSTFILEYGHLLVLETDETFLLIK